MPAWFWESLIKQYPLLAERYHWQDQLRQNHKLVLPTHKIETMDDAYHQAASFIDHLDNPRQMEYRKRQLTIEEQKTWIEQQMEKLEQMACRERHRR